MVFYHLIADNQMKKKRILVLVISNEVFHCRPETVKHENQNAHAQKGEAS